MGHQCSKFHCYRIQYKQISTNNIYKVTLPEAVCCCLQTCNDTNYGLHIMCTKFHYSK